VLDRVAEALQPGERGIFDDGFGEVRHILVLVAFSLGPGNRPYLVHRLEINVAEASNRDTMSRFVSRSYFEPRKQAFIATWCRDCCRDHD